MTIQMLCVRCNCTIQSKRVTRRHPVKEADDSVILADLFLEIFVTQGMTLAAQIVTQTLL